MKNRSARGFTLLEMSIVLLIIGTIVGAIMFGRTLLITSRLQTVISDADSYTSAVANFKQTYQSLPGDMVSATNIWGYPAGASSGDTPPYSTSCATLTGTGTQTCNGNGDGEIGSVSGQEYETFRFWQHLYDAKMFSQPVTGVSGNGGSGLYDSKPGVNVPVSAFEGSGFSAIWFGTITASSAGYCAATDCFYTTPPTSSGGAAGTSLFYGNVLQFGGVASGYTTHAPILTPDQAASMDAKIDDGYPATGKIRAYVSTSTINPNCTVVTGSNANCSSATTSPGCYNVSSTSSKPLCSLIFVTGF